MALPRGFAGGAVAAGLKKSGKLDLGLIYSEGPCVASAVFTKNLFIAPNLTISKRHLARGAIHGIVVNAGQSNACTGKAGEQVAKEMAEKAGAILGKAPEDFLIGSTGVIGSGPDPDKVAAGLGKIVTQGLSAEGLRDVGRAFMTTDLVKKSAEASLKFGGKTVRIFGIAKGSGMINPSMATMLSYIMTDAKISSKDLRKAFKLAVEASFNCLTVDGDTSTSDMVAILANGAAGNDTPDSEDYERFIKKLTVLCQDLARQIARDGEGATRLVTVRVKNAAAPRDARDAAKAVASSNLVKTAIFGRDPNWGRIACAVGYSGASFDPNRVTIKLGKSPIFSGGRPAKQDQAALRKYLRDNEEILIDIDLDAGTDQATVWTCDFSYDYVRINAEYTT